MGAFPGTNRSFKHSDTKWERACLFLISQQEWEDGSHVPAEGTAKILPPPKYTEADSVFRLKPT